MRLHLALEIQNSNSFPLNYNYQLASAIYQKLQLSTPEFAEFLHDKGYISKGRAFKFFTFALKFNVDRVANNSFMLRSRDMELYVSSPLMNDFISHLLAGIHQDPMIQISFNQIYITAKIKQAEVVPPPQFSHNMKFNFLSPLVLTRTDGLNEKNKLIQHFLRYNENIEDINRAFNNNLIKKYETLTELEYDGEGVSIEWDRNYIKEKESKGKRITQKVTIPKANERDIDIIGNTAPIYISGDPFLMVVGYEAGFGEKNSMGFGLAEEAKKRN